MKPEKTRAEKSTAGSLKMDFARDLWHDRKQLSREVYAANIAADTPAHLRRKAPPFVYT